MLHHHQSHIHIYLSQPPLSCFLFPIPVLLFPLSKIPPSPITYYLLPTLLLPGFLFPCFLFPNSKFPNPNPKSKGCKLSCTFCFCKSSSQSACKGLYCPDLVCCPPSQCPPSGSVLSGFSGCSHCLQAQGLQPARSSLLYHLSKIVELLLGIHFSLGRCHGYHKQQMHSQQQ